MAQQPAIFPPPPLEPSAGSPIRPRSPIRSPIRSPKRRSRILAEEIDPLLDNLSPEVFLNALSAINAVSDDEQHAKDLLFKTISSTSLEEQAFGAGAAIAAQRLREWLEELRAWQWPSEKYAQLGKGFVAPSTTQRGGSEQKYWGCLPVHVVITYEKRVEAIRDGIEGLDVESLKDYVLSAHVGSRSRPSSSHSTASTAVAPLSYVQLRDFTAIVTVTILRALPTLTRLLMLLKIWDVRLFVLRQIPGLLRALNLAKNTIESSLTALRNRSVENEDIFSLEAFRATKDRLEGLVVSAGRRMDRVLDALDGREDSLPEDWIDTLEAVEADFATWTVEAEKRAIENELKRYGPSKSLRRTPSALLAQPSSILTMDDSNMSEPVSGQAARPVPENLSRQSPLSTSVSDEEAEECILEEDIVNSNNVSATADSVTNEHEPISSSAHRTQLTPTIIVEKDPMEAIDKMNAETSQDPKSIGSSSHKNVRTVTSPTNNSPRSDSEGIVAVDSQQESTVNAPSDIEGFLSGSSSQNAPSETALAVKMPPVEIDDALSQAEVSLVEPHLQLPVRVEAVETASLETAEKDLSLDSLVSSSPLESPLVPPVAMQTVPETSATKTEHETSLSMDKLPLSKEDIVFQEATRGTSKKVAAPKKSDTQFQSLPVSDPPEGFASNSRDVEGESDLRELEVPSPETTSSVAQKSPAVSTNIIELGPSNVSLEPSTQDKAALPSSPATNADSDRTLRDVLPQESPASLPFYPTFRHEAQEASLPLQRFINEGLDPDFEMEEPLDDDSVLEESFEESPSLKNLPANMSNQNRTRVRERQGSLSPPAEILARPAIAPSRSKISQIPSLAKVNPSLQKRPFKPGKENVPSRVSITKKESGLRQSSLPSKISSSGPKTPLNPTRLPISSNFARRLREQPSIDSIGSISHRSEIEYTRNLQPEVIGDDSLATMSPFQDTDDDLHEKINSILTGIPGRIRLNSVPAQDADQQSVISSTSSSRRHMLHSKSSFSSLSRSGTPTPSITMAPAFSRTKRPHAHSKDDNAVRVYHLHHKGKTQPTKLFVRSVGPNGERVMVRVGGGWADLGEYLREYVLHHGRRAVSTGKVEVQGLPTPSSDTFSTPNSIVTLTPEADRNIVPSRPGSVLSNRPSSSLAVRKIRRPSRPSGDLPSLTPANIETSSPDLLSPTIPVSSRRLSVSSVNSVSVSSTIGEYLNQSGTPYQPSGRTPSSASHSTPLGLAGPKPRSRQVSMTPESEAWVEDIVGQARKTSSSLKPDHTHNQRPESRLDQQDHSSSVRSSRRRNSNARSVSDIGASGLNRRVLLRGLDSGNRRE